MPTADVCPSSEGRLALIAPDRGSQDLTRINRFLGVRPIVKEAEMSLLVRTRLGLSSMARCIEVLFDGLAEPASAPLAGLQEVSAFETPRGSRQDYW